MCQPGNYLPVTGSSGRELKPLQGENRGHISFLSFLFISLPLSGSFSVILLASLSIFSHYFSVQTNGGPIRSICGFQIGAVFFFFTLITFLPLFPYVLSHLSLKWVTVWFCVSISSEWGKEGQSERKLGQCATVHNSNTYTGALPAHIQKPSQRSDVKQWFYFIFLAQKWLFCFFY